MAQQIPSGVIPILRACKAQMLAAKLASSDAIFYLAQPQLPPNFTADLAYILRPRGFTSIQSQYQGAGRFDTRIRRVLDIYLRLRIGRDEADRDNQWLLDAAGFFVAEEKLLDALHGFHPVDTAGNTLTTEPIRVIQGSDPDRERHKGSGTGWGDALISFEMIYMLALTQDYL